MFLARYDQPILTKIQNLDLAKYPKIRRQDLDVMLMTEVLSRANQRGVSLVFRHEKSDLSESEFDILEDQQIVGKIWALASGDDLRWYLLTVSADKDAAITIERLDQQPITRRKKGMHVWDSITAAVRGPEIQGWADAVVAKAVEIKTPTASKKWWSFGFGKK